MKSFRQFWEEASLSDLHRKHAQSAEGKRESRLSARNKAETEAQRRFQQSKNITKRNRAKMLAKKREAEARLSQLQHDSAQNRALQRSQNERARQKAAETGHNVRQAVKGTYQLGKIAVKGVKKAVKRRKNRSQSGT